MGSDKEKKAPVDVLLALAKDFFLFHTPDKVPFSIIGRGDHKETYRIESKAFAYHLCNLYLRATDQAIPQGSLDTAVRQLAAKAIHDGPEIDVYSRVAPCNPNGIAVDLGDSSWKSVVVTPYGWEIEAPQFPFIRTSAMTALPVPDKSGQMEELWNFVNVRSEENRLLLAAWIMCAFFQRMPHPILVLQGQQGAAKSTTAKLLLSLVDPSTVPLQSLPSSERDLLIAAQNSWVLAFDNIRRLSSETSDAMCRLATGGGLRTRKLYTDCEEILFNATRPLIFTGIHNICNEQDLLSRALVVELEPISLHRRKTETELMARFEKARPRILGGLLSALSGVLRELPQVRLEGAPRMADFAKIGMALEQAMALKPGAFMKAYTANINQAVDASLDDDPVAQALMSLVAQKGGWRGTASRLLKALDRFISNEAKKSSDWPSLPNRLSNHLRRLSPGLAAAGIEVTFDQNIDGEKRVIVITPQGASELEHPHPGGPVDGIAIATASAGESAGTAQASELAADVPDVLPSKDQKKLRLMDFKL